MAEPLTPAEAKAHLRVTSSFEDDVITDIVRAARGWIEDYTGLILVRRQVTETLTGFDRHLRAWPVISVDAVSYVDVDGLSQVLATASYSLQSLRRPAALLTASGLAWPRLYTGTAVAVTVTAGFENAAAIDALSPNILRAMRLVITAYYENRGQPLSDDAERAVGRLLRNFKRRLT